MRTNFSVLAISIIILLSSCEKTNPPGPIDTGYTHGIFITNEGAFGNSNGSVSYIDQDSMKLYNNLFSQLNGRPLGDVVQSISIHNDRAYIVVNNSQKIEVVDLTTFNSVGVIEGLSYPRYFLGIDQNKGYVSNGAMEGMIYVIDLISLTKTDSIQVGYGPEQMIQHGNTVYVANSGGWSYDNTISLIDSRNDEVTETVEIGDNPVALELDQDNMLWVLCKGKVVYDNNWSIIEETDSKLVKLNTESRQIEKSIVLGQTGDFFQSTLMALNPAGNTIIFAEAGGIYEMDINADSPSSAPLISMSFYGIDIDPDSGDIYGLSAGDFTSSGYVYRYEPDGTVKDTLEVGIAPNMALFN